MGVDYQVYMCVAILRHLEQDILLHQQHQDLIIFLRVSAFMYVVLWFKFFYLEKNKLGYVI